MSEEVFRYDADGFFMLKNQRTGLGFQSLSRLCSRGGIEPEAVKKNADLAKVIRAFVWCRRTICEKFLCPSPANPAMTWSATGTLASSHVVRPFLFSSLVVMNITSCPNATA
jgi:hypothetical protein